jgi:hypothetical protein
VANLLVDALHSPNLSRFIHRAAQTLLLHICYLSVAFDG